MSNMKSTNAQKNISKGVERLLLPMREPLSGKIIRHVLIHTTMDMNLKYFQKLAKAINRPFRGNCKLDYDANVIRKMINYNIE